MTLIVLTALLLAMRARGRLLVVVASRAMTTAATLVVVMRRRGPVCWMNCALTVALCRRCHLLML